MLSVILDSLKVWPRNFRAWFYRHLPPFLPAWQLKRRAGYERRWGSETDGFTKEGFFGILQERFLAGIRPGLWVELRAGDGLVSSLGVWLEPMTGWRVEAWEDRKWAARSFRKNRRSTHLHQERLISWKLPEAPKDPVGVTARGVREAAGLCRAIRGQLIRPALVGIWNPSRKVVWEKRLRREGYRLELVWHNVEFHRDSFRGSEARSQVSGVGGADAKKKNVNE